MLTNPKTLFVDAPVSEVRAILQNPSVQMVLVDDDASLLGLLCLDESRTRFCGAAGSGTVDA